jgi:hypothetical protein
VESEIKEKQIMTTKFDHNKYLKVFVKERLSPYGIVQKGQSRTFLLDKGWYIIVIEFQNSGWSKGTYLNIGVDFNFYPREYYSFRYGYREADFNTFENEQQFKAVLIQLCDITIKKIQALEKQFSNIPSSIKTLEKVKNIDYWRDFDIAILNALISNFDLSKQLLNRIIVAQNDRDWEKQRNEKCIEIRSWFESNQNITENLVNLVNETRSLKKLPKIDFDSLLKEIQLSNQQETKSSWWKIWT